VPVAAATSPTAPHTNHRRRHDRSSTASCSLNCGNRKCSRTSGVVNSGRPTLIEESGFQPSRPLSRLSAQLALPAGRPVSDVIRRRLNRRGVRGDPNSKPGWTDPHAGGFSRKTQTVRFRAPERRWFYSPRHRRGGLSRAPAWAAKSVCIHSAARGRERDDNHGRVLSPRP